VAPVEWVPEVGARVGDLDQAIGRGHVDMRTPLNLQSLNDDGLVVRVPDGGWALTAQGIVSTGRSRTLRSLRPSLLLSSPARSVETLSQTRSAR
jgi:hypothetical protein